MNALRYLAGLAVGIAIMSGPAAQAPQTLPPCAAEDSVGCYWDAATRGNGQGESFWVGTDGVQHSK